ncbi:MAG: serine/threonine-protein kinase, partial [Chloroflexota bacterium]
MEQPQTIGRYRITAEIGRGGMATVYLAHDPSFDRDVAVKVLPREFSHDPTFRERFEREARTIAQLEHNAIVPVYDVGTEDGMSYLVMRYMPGGSLAERIELGAIPVGETARILADVASGLDEAHVKGVVHRD